MSTRNTAKGHLMLSFSVLDAEQRDTEVTAKVKMLGLEDTVTVTAQSLTMGPQLAKLFADAPWEDLLRTQSAIIEAVFSALQPGKGES